MKEVTADLLHQWIPKRPREAHKGDFGKILLLCGAVGYTGAAALSAMAAARSGAGLIYLGVPETVYPIVAGKLLEPVVFPLPDKEGKFSQEAIPEILKRLEACDACLVGCGIGQSPGTLQVVKAVLSQAKCPVVVDADGINVLREHIDVLRGAACPMILTPHEGEAARLDPEGKNLDRLERVQRLQRLTGATVLLKGHRTLIFDGEECYINRCGNPGMARGGSGDVLSGIIVSLLGQGLSLMQAAAAGAWLHGKAGDLCADELGEAGMLPSDMIQALPRLLK